MTQFEVVVSVERISEVYLIPALEHLLASFPFVIRGFHADNGSEYINRRVARLLEKLRIEFTKSRARHSNDNALVECKNGSCASCSAMPIPTLGRPADFHSIPTSTIIGPLLKDRETTQASLRIPDARNSNPSPTPKRI